jgi:hypothetical protein
VEAGGGLDEVGVGGLGGPARLDQRVFTGELEQRGRLEDHFEDDAFADGRAYRGDVVAHRVEIARHRSADVDHHVDLDGSRCGRQHRLVRLDGGEVLARRESDHRRDHRPRRLRRLRGGHHRRRHAGGVHAECVGLAHQRDDVGLGGLWLEQGVVDEFGHRVAGPGHQNGSRVPPGLQPAAIISSPVTSGRHGSRFQLTLPGSAISANCQWQMNCSRMPGIAASGDSASTSAHATSAGAEAACRPDGVG